MGVRVLVGKADGTTDAAVFYDSVTGWTLGRIIEADDAGEQAEAFLAWLGSHRWYAVRAAIFGGEHRSFMLLGRDHMNGRDLRDWTPTGFDRLWRYWHGAYVNEAGLVDPLACLCGHHHLEGDAGGDAGCASCGCVEWRPGNPVAVEHAIHGGKVLV